jgi:hypothetical protein
MFYDITSSAKAVTVKVPSSTSEYGSLPTTYSGADSTIT